MYSFYSSMGFRRPANGFPSRKRSHLSRLLKWKVWFWILRWSLLINQGFALTSCKDTRELIWGGLRLLSRIERTFPVGTKARVQLEAHLSLTLQDLDFLNDPEHSRSELTWTDYPHYIFFRKASCGGEIVTGHNSSTPPFKIAGFIRLSDVGSRGTYIRSKNHISLRRSVVPYSKRSHVRIKRYMP